MKSLYYAKMRSRQCAETWVEGSSEDEAPELTASVGQGGTNRASDVRNVQSRFNRVAPEDGGPATLLKVDGLCGPLTRGAILHFQQHHPGLLHDSRIDPGRNTWKRLLLFSDGIEVADIVPVGGQAGGQGGGPDPKAPTAPHPAPAPNPALDPTMPIIAMFLARHRIAEAIKGLDIAQTELDALNVKSFLRPDPKDALFHTYEENKTTLKELPTVDRCFHVTGQKMTHAKVSDMLRRLRKIYSSMLDVIFATVLTTPAAEKAGTRRYVRVIKQTALNKIHPGGAIADAPDQGWWNKNANIGHIRVGSAHLDDSDLITTMIHEMSHFVSHHTSYIVGAHVSGTYNKAFDDTHAQAVRNAFCYEWYAFLASFKSQRTTPNASLVLS